MVGEEEEEEEEEEEDEEEEEEVQEAEELGGRGGGVCRDHGGVCGVVSDVRRLQEGAHLLLLVFSKAIHHTEV